jgi:hypothetical protein
MAIFFHAFSDRLRSLRFNWPLSHRPPAERVAWIFAP